MSIELDTALERHRDAARRYAEAAAQVPRERWHQARHGDKWSAAEITKHLVLAFDAVERELRGGPGMQPRLTGWKRQVARLIYMRRILRDGAFPRGVRAPRESRPTGAMPAQDEGIAEFSRRVSEMEELVRTLHVQAPHTSITHPYFGAIGLVQMVFISARHMEHHRTDLTA